MMKEVSRRYRHTFWNEEVRGLLGKKRNLDVR